MTLVWGIFGLALHKSVMQWAKNIEWCNNAHPNWFDWATVWNKWPHRLFHNLVFPSVLLTLSALAVTLHSLNYHCCCCYLVIWVRCLFLQLGPLWVTRLRLNLERKVKMDSTCRRCLGHCLTVNLTQHVLNAIRGSFRTDREDFCCTFKGVLYYMYLFVCLFRDFQNWFARRNNPSSFSFLWISKGELAPEGVCVKLLRPQLHC